MIEFRAILSAAVVLAVLAPLPAAAVVKGGDIPQETCARREANGTLTTGKCSEVCKDKTIYEPNTDAEVDAISGGGGVCNASAGKVTGRELKLSPNAGAVKSP
jgi:hypothetical protein